MVMAKEQEMINRDELLDEVLACRISKVEIEIKYRIEELGSLFYKLKVLKAKQNDPLVRCLKDIISR